MKKEDSLTVSRQVASRDILVHEAAPCMRRSENTSNQLLVLLGDDAVRGILTATDRSPMSAQMLDQRCDASLTTIYRRLEDLLEHQLLQVETAVRPDGNHYKLYEANLDHLNVTLSDGDFDVELAKRDDAPDRFRGIWDAMQGRER